LRIIIRTIHIDITITTGTTISTGIDHAVTAVLKSTKRAASVRFCEGIRLGEVVVFENMVRSVKVFIVLMYAVSRFSCLGTF